MNRERALTLAARIQEVKMKIQSRLSSVVPILLEGFLRLVADFLRLDMPS